ncbi:hypothetical protein DFH28DRAFT_978334, partial [Melampsora americana]
MTYRGYKINQDPIPLVSFSLGLPSRLFSILSTHQHHPFNVHLLNSIKGIEDQELLHQFDNDQIRFGKLVCKIWKTIVL